MVPRGRRRASNQPEFIVSRTDDYVTAGKTIISLVPEGLHHLLWLQMVDGPAGHEHEKNREYL
jgi:hypothetical protein